MPLLEKATTIKIGIDRQKLYFVQYNLFDYGSNNTIPDVLAATTKDKINAIKIF